MSEIRIPNYMNSRIMRAYRWWVLDSSRHAGYVGNVMSEIAGFGYSWKQASKIVEDFYSEMEASKPVPNRKVLPVGSLMKQAKKYGAKFINAPKLISKVKHIEMPRSRGMFPYKRKSTKRFLKRRSFNNRVKSVINRVKEAKFIDTAISISNAVAGTSQIIPISLVATGDTELLRDGEEIGINTIEINLEVRCGPSVEYDTHNRVMLVRSKHNIEGVLPLITELLMSDSVTALKQIDSRGDYTSYLNKHQLVKIANQDATTADQNQAVGLLRYFKRLRKPMKCTFDASGATIGAAERGHWFLVLMTNQSSSFQPLFTGNVRVMFKDI